MYTVSVQDVPYIRTAPYDTYVGNDILHISVIHKPKQDDTPTFVRFLGVRAGYTGEGLRMADELKLRITSADVPSQETTTAFR